MQLAPNQIIKKQGRKPSTSGERKPKDLNVKSQAVKKPKEIHFMKV